MVLNGDILDYENVGVEEEFTDEEVMAVSVLLAIGNVISMVWPTIQRLRGGSPMTLAIKRDYNDMDFDRELIDLGQRAAQYGGEWLMNKTRDVFARRTKARMAGKAGLRGGSAGSSMLAWKNSLTKMYHTYMAYHMSVVLNSVVVGTKYVHKLQAGVGPHLYWNYHWATAATGDDNSRNINWNTLQYWDGGFGANPTDEVPYSAGPPVVPYVSAKNWRLGTTGTVYVFNADWIGTIMNHDTNTQDTSSQTLTWLNVAYAGTVTTTNYPRLLTSVFANTSWQYLTVFGIQYRFDVTNFSAHDYVLEISLFRFKADIDAMDYEKQALAHFGGYHTGTNPYCQRLPFLPMADVNIISTKRYTIKGMRTMYGTNATFIEGSASNNRTIKYNIKRKYTMKRPLLNSYETTLTEKEIYTKYYDAQKGIYFRMMAWPTDILAIVNAQQGSITTPVGEGSTNPNVPNVNNLPASLLGNGLDIVMYKKAYFKMDENSPTF